MANISSKERFSVLNHSASLTPINKGYLEIELKQILNLVKIAKREENTTLLIWSEIKIN